MNSTVTLTLVEEDDVVGEYVFKEHAHCIVGRSHQCDINVPANPLFQDVSRHHCELDIDPPSVRLRDLGSLNGTYLNGIKIGQRENLKWAEDHTIGVSEAIELSPGDEVKLGQHTTLRVAVSPSPEDTLGGSARDSVRETGGPHHARR